MSSITTREWFTFTPEAVELREAGGSSPTITGYAAVFNRKSHDLGGFVEVIKPGAFDETLTGTPDVAARVQHQGGLGTIGRTTNGTLKLTANAKGLKYEVTPPNTQAGRDIVELIRRGDISKSSFAFSLRGDNAEHWDWSTNPPTRELLRLNLHDVAPVDGPAYEDTSVSVRAFEAAKTTRIAPQNADKPADDPKPTGPHTINIYDTIGPAWMGMYGGKTLLRDMEGIGEDDPIDVRIKSPGGDVFEGTAIHNRLVAHKGQVRVFVDGMALSAASLIAMAGDEIHIASTAYMMIHDPWTITIGNPAELRKTTDLLDRMADTIASAYATRTGKALEVVRQMMRDETWFFGEEAKASGFATHVLPSKAAEIKVGEEVAQRFKAMPHEFAVAAKLCDRTDPMADAERRINEYQEWCRKNRAMARANA